MKRKFMLNATTLLLIATVCLSVTALASGQEAEATKPNKRDAKETAAIRAVLDTQVAAWNRGDIEGFMDGYWRSDETVFVSGDTVTHGWAVVLDRYKKGYDTRDKMGTLAFSDLEIKLISKDAAVALGRWQLTRASDTPHGRFTLIFRRTPQGWRIVHDHTSSAS
ncbi:MAG TPA: nuclear transport factor 2 family protein [Pyrinomonadaceae bacterium]|jgi:beta-aspartyl-peptidase (threonine type)|nr:nuclear transport factor 2 family protein [Pyrinomonadaceae bacterium]